MIPPSPSVHLFGGAHVLLPNGNRIYELDDADYRAISEAVDARDETRIASLLTALGLDAPPFVDDAPLRQPPLRAISLAVAQKCNLGCTYCYAQQGAFGGPSKSMTLETAIASIDFLLRGVSAGERVNVAFLGGEPLINRPVIRAATEHAQRAAAAKGVQATFSITSNGTLITEDDGRFFEEHAFAVTVSLDGVGAVHDALRPRKGGGGTFDAVMERVEPLLRMQRRMQVSARVTVTPRNLGLRAVLDDFLARGFHSVGFSPMLFAPADAAGVAMHADDLDRMLASLIECGEEFRRRVVAGERYAFLNIANAMREIHRGTHRPYPCGAGASYLGVSAEGDLAACHRFVGDDLGVMGDVTRGIDGERQSRWLDERHVARQEPCRSCWARYMCSGSCHYEAMHRGRDACDFIRGWLHYCLETYVALLRDRPDYFE
jgi:uncharacterized protein